MPRDARGPEVPSLPTPHGREIAASAPPAGSIFFFAALGAAAQTIQVVLLRELVSAFDGNELTIGLVLAGWTFWGAAGCLAGTCLRGGRGPFLATVAGAAVAVPASLGVAAVARSLAGLPPGTALPIDLATGLALGVPAPAAFFLGALFPLAVRLDAPSEAGRWGYGVECAGAAFAGWLLTALLLPRLEGFAIAAGALGVLLAGAAAAALPRRAAAVTALLAVAAGASAAVFLAPTASARASAAYWAWRQGEDAPSSAAFTTVEEFPASHGRVTVRRYANPGVAGSEEWSIYRSGHLVLTVPDQGEAAAEAALGMLQVPEPATARVLVLGEAPPGFLASVLDHGPAEVTFVTPAPEVVLAARRYTDDRGRRALDDPRLRWVTGDLRRFVRGDAARYDVIFSRTGDPATVEMSRLFTREFFALLAERLTPAGVAVIGPLTSGLGAEILYRNAAILGALEASFPEVALTSGTTAVFLAGRPGSFTVSEDALLERMVARRTLADLGWALHPGEIASTRAALESRGAGASRDARPLLQALTVEALRRGEGGGGPGLLSLALRWPPTVLVIGPLFLLLPFVALARPSRGAAAGRAAAALAVFAAGWASMSLEVTLLLGYQTAHGNVLGDVALLVGLTMLGLAAGALAAGRPVLVRRAGAVLPASATSLAALALGLAALAGGGVPDLSPAAYGLALFLTGLLAGLSFPPAASRFPAGSGAGLLYGADLLGACAGGLATSLGLLPGAGFAGALLSVALLALAATAPFVLLSRSGRSAG